MTFRELMVLLRLYRAAPPELRRWADQRLPELREAAELTEGQRVAHTISGPVQDATQFDTYRLSCSCGWKWSGSAADALAARQEHVGEPR